MEGGNHLSIRTFKATQAVRFSLALSKALSGRSLALPLLRYLRTGTLPNRWAGRVRLVLTGTSLCRVIKLYLSAGVLRYPLVVVVRLIHAATCNYQTPW